MEKIVDVEVFYSGVVNFAMQQNYVPIIKKLTLKNITKEEMRDVELVIRTEPQFSYDWSIRIDSIPPLQSIVLGTIDLKLSPDFLYSLTESIAGAICVKVKTGDTELENVYSIEALAYDQWSGTQIMPEIVCAFITPNHPKVTEIIIKANQILNKWVGSPSFIAYQSKNPNNVKMQMAAIYTVLQQESIAYCMPPASFEMVGQRVRLSESVLQQKLGTCLDLSLLYAGCLEAVGLNPLIIFLKGHAFVGCWLEEQSFSECLQDDISLITKRIAEGINEICLVETTCFVAGKMIMFDDAVRAGNNNLTVAENFEFLVDIRRTRGSGIRPIPLRKIAGDGSIIYNGLEDRNNSNIFDPKAPKELEAFDKINHVASIDISRQQIWERKLLDLSLRNTLVNFRVTKNAIQLMVNQLCELEDALASGEEFSIMEKPKDWENTLRDSKIFAVENNNTAMDSLVRTLSSKTKE